MTEIKTMTVNGQTCSFVDEAVRTGLSELKEKTRQAPDYILAEAQRVAKAVQANRTTKSLVFPVISDMHLYAGNSSEDNSLISANYAGMGIEELKKRIKLDFVGYLGDYTYGDTKKPYSAEQVMKDITAFKETTNTDCTEIWCVGNHDWNYGIYRDRVLNTDEQYCHIGANSAGVKPYGDLERSYGYLDFENQKIRVIYLNTCDGSDWPVTAGKNATCEWISPTQLQWLADTALDFTGKTAPGQWGIVILGHHPLHYPTGCFNHTMKILEAYKNGTKGSLTCTVCTGKFQTVTYDFTDIERAEIICNIHGHTHNCAYSKISSTTNGEGAGGTTPVEEWLWRLAIPNICAGRYNTGYSNFKDSNLAVAQMLGEFDASGNPVSWTKETGTANATSFCVVNIDRKNKKLYAHIFGAGTDRVISYGADEAEPAVYTVTSNLTNVTVSNAATSVTEGASYTNTLTANSGYILDSVAVTMGGSPVTVTDGVIRIASVTGDIVITATAVAREAEPAYTNQIPISTDAEGNLYNGTGYKDGYKIGSGAGEDVATAGYATTGFIPIGIGSATGVVGEQVIYLSGIAAVAGNSNIRIAFYKADKSYIGASNSTNWIATDPTVAEIKYTLGDDGYINTIDVSAVTGYYKQNSDIETTYFRFCAPGIDGDSVITVNEPIV